jgi:hypothetical protein
MFPRDAHELAAAIVAAVLGAALLLAWSAVAKLVSSWL